MRVLVTGARGLLGTAVCRSLASRDIETIALSRAEFDISDPESVARVATRDFGDLEVVINCAAYTAVDRAETEEREAFEANQLGVSYLGQACAMSQTRMIHFGTDFVFDGTAEEPYREDDATAPLGVYGRSKLAGEQALLGNPQAVTLRLSWLFGPDGPCFPRSILRAASEGRPLRVVADQVGTPTYTLDVAEVVADMVQRPQLPGVIHVAGPEAMSWHAFASLAVSTCLKDPPAITPISTEDWPTPARRPRYSPLDTSRLRSMGMTPMRGTAEALADFCRRVNSEHFGA